jgi:hypothetical protein
MKGTESGIHKHMLHCHQGKTERFQPNKSTKQMNLDEVIS